MLITTADAVRNLVSVLARNFPLVEDLPNSAMDRIPDGVRTSRRIAAEDSTQQGRVL